MKPRSYQKKPPKIGFREHLPDILFWTLLAVFAYVFFVNAWIVDEGYVTFRTIDNFVNGNGLNWNVQERVQAYTHPFWLFVICLAYIFTSEFFFTSIVVSFIFSAAVFIVFYYYARRKSESFVWLPALFLLTLLASKAFVDYTSSGLENPLSYFLVALFYARLLFDDKGVEDFSRSDLLYMIFIASLAFFNRQDTIFLYIVPVTFLIIAGMKRYRFGFLRTLLLATSPAWLWTVFSVIYYGFPYPNTAYAKLINAGVPIGAKILRGLEYLFNSVKLDSILYIILIWAFVWAIRQGKIKIIWALSSVMIYFLYVISSAASATHMSGRFFSVPFVVIALCFVLLMERKKPALMVSAVLVIYILIHPMSSIKMGTEWYYVPEQNPSFMDTKYAAHDEGGGLTENLGKDVVPNHSWYFDGLLFRELPEKVHRGGPNESAAIGYFAFAAGPNKYIIDLVGLGDPLMARLPAANTAVYLPDNWHSGHFYRMEPIGYAESVRDENNQIVEAGLHEYYNHLLVIIKGPIFSWERIRTIYHMNMGDYNYLLDYYTENINKARRRGIL